MQTSQNGKAIIKHYEGSHTQAYLCPAKKWTIGVGHTGLVDGKPIVKGMIITQQKVEELLTADLKSFERGVSSLVKVPITQGQFDALVSFAFNCGLDIDADNTAEGLGDSTLLKYVNQKQFDLASKEFIKWNKGGGKVLDGLTKRRKCEALLFSTGKLKII